jgi:hypothetical protein
MNRSSATGRPHPVVGAALALGVALGAAFVAGGATRDDAGIVSQTGPPSVRPVADCVSMDALAADVAGATSPSGGAAAVHAVRGRAAAAARATRSDDLREVAQNLADDLAAFRVALTTTSADPSVVGRRRADIDVMIRGDLAALRLLCGR